MRIAHFTNTFIPTISGVVRNVATIQKSLTELGNQVFIFTEKVNGHANPHPHIFRYPTLNFRLPMDFPAIFPFSPTIDKQLTQLQLDIIHTHHPFSLGHAAAAKARRLNLPLIFTFHTLYWEHAHYVPLPASLAQKIVREIIEKRVRDFVRRCDHIVVYTESLQRMLRTKYDLGNKVSVVPTAIDLAPYQSLNPMEIRSQLGWGIDPVMISVGRLGIEKNWMTLLEAGIHAMRVCPKLRIVIIGDGPERDRLQHYALNQGADGQVSFMGKIPFEEIPKYLKAADLFGFASTTETIGRVTIEALAAGLPIVAVNATGTRDIVEHDREGLLTDNNAQALGEAIIKVLGDESLRARYRVTAEQKSKLYNLEREAGMLLDVYQRVIKETRI